MPIKYNENLRKSEVISQNDNATTLRVLVTSFGSPEQKDLHGEFFHPDTYFGDDQVTVKHALYEHMMNSMSNPYMPVEKQHLGKAKLAKTDEWGRWFDFEISRSLEYHDFLVGMAQKGVLGASTQCYPNGKKMNEKVEGKIDYWLESEVSLTPTPADPKTIGEIIELAKSFGVDLKMVKGEEVVEAIASEEIVEDDVIDNLPDELDAALNGKDEEEAVDEIDIPEEGVDELSGDDMKQLIIAQAKSINSLVSEVKNLKASMSVYIDMWGDVEEVRAALSAMMSTQKSVEEDVIPLLNRVNKKTDATVKTTESFVNYIKNFKESEAGQRYIQYSQAERDALENLEDELDTPSSQYHPGKIFGTRLPVGAPGVN